MTYGAVQYFFKLGVPSNMHYVKQHPPLYRSFMTTGHGTEGSARLDMRLWSEDDLVLLSLFWQNPSHGTDECLSSPLSSSFLIVPCFLLVPTYCSLAGSTSRDRPLQATRKVNHREAAVAGTAPFEERTIFMLEGGQSRVASSVVTRVDAQDRRRRT